MKQLPISIAQALGSDASSLSCCWGITRKDGVVLRFTDAPQDLVVGGQTFSSVAGPEASAVSDTATMSVDNMEVKALALLTGNDGVLIRDVEVGRYDGAQTDVFFVDRRQPDAGLLHARTGWLGELKHQGQMFGAELRGLLQAMQQTIVELVSKQCRASLGDSRCKVDLAPHRVERTVLQAAEGRTIIVEGTLPAPVPVEDDYTAERIARDAEYQLLKTEYKAIQEDLDEAEPQDRPALQAQLQAKARELDTVRERLAELRVVGQDDIFAYGLCEVLTGQAAGWKVEIRRSDAHELVLLLPVPLPIAPGDTVRLTAGCPRTLASCKVRFNNVVNFRGEPHCPDGFDALRPKTLGRPADPANSLQPGQPMRMAVMLDKVADAVVGDAP